MKKRPLCIVALIWATVVWLLGAVGMPGFSFAPPNFPAEGKKEAATVAGIVYDISVYEKKTVFYLKQANLFYQSSYSAVQQKYPLDRIKVNIKNENLVEKNFQGSEVAVYGSLEEIPLPGNPGQFNERIYYYTRKIKWYLDGKQVMMLEKEQDKILKYQKKIKDWMQRGIRRGISKEKASIIEAMVLGEKENMDQKDMVIFQLLGCSHILAVSGLHLSVLGGGLFRILRKCSLPLWTSALISAVGMIFYGGMTGNGASVMRAIIMFGISMGGYVLKRTYDFLSAVSVAAILLLCESSCYLYDSSFLLSFGAVLGIGVVYPILFVTDKRKNLVGLLKNGLCSGIAVWITIFPLVLYFFNEIPIWGILVSVVLMPLAPILLILGLLLGILGNLQWNIVIYIVGHIVTVILNLFLVVGAVLKKVPGALWIAGQPELCYCVFYYIAVILFLLKGNWKRMVLYGIAFILLLFPIPKGKVKITFLDVGQGDCACIQTINGHCYLIDGGSTTVSGVGKYRILPFLKASGINRIQGIFISHMDADHVNGIQELLELTVTGESNIKIEKLFLSRCSGTKDKLENLERLGKSAKCQIYYIERGSVISEKDILSIQCIGPEKNYEDSNESSQVLHVSSGAFDILFTGDVERQGEADMLEHLKKLDVDWEILKVAHHGSENSTGEEFLQYVNPKISIVSCGKKNAYGHPHKELMQRLKKYTEQIFITKDKGAICFFID